MVIISYRSTEKFHSTQNSHNIDQEEYNELYKECAVSALALLLLGRSETEIDTATISYLLSVATPTAMLLIKDLKKLDRKARAIELTR